MDRSNGSVLAGGVVWSLLLLMLPLLRLRRRCAEASSTSRKKPNWRSASRAVHAGLAARSVRNDKSQHLERSVVRLDGVVDPVDDGT